MIIDNSKNDVFLSLYEDDPLGFLTKAHFDSEIAKEKIKTLRDNLSEIEREIERIEKAEKKLGLYWKYQRGELPRIHCSLDPFENVFLDALSIQADRILENLSKAFPDMTEEEIRNACFRGDKTKGIE